MAVKRTTLMKVPNIDQYPGSPNSVTLFSIDPYIENSGSENYDPIKRNLFVNAKDIMVDIIFGGYVDTIPSISVSHNWENMSDLSNLIGNPEGALQRALSAFIPYSPISPVTSRFHNVKQYTTSSLKPMTVEIYVTNDIMTDWVKVATDRLLQFTTGMEYDSSLSDDERLNGTKKIIQVNELITDLGSVVIQMQIASVDMIRDIVNEIAQFAGINVGNGILKDVTETIAEVGSSIFDLINTSRRIVNNIPIFRQNVVIRPRAVMAVWGDYLAMAPMCITNVDIEPSKSFIDTIYGNKIISGAKFKITLTHMLPFLLQGQTGLANIISYNSDIIRTYVWGAVANDMFSLHNSDTKQYYSIFGANKSMFTWKNVITQFTSNRILYPRKQDDRSIESDKVFENLKAKIEQFRKKVGGQ